MILVRQAGRLIKIVLLPPFTPWGIAGTIVFVVIDYLIGRFERAALKRAEEEAVRRTVLDLLPVMENYVNNNQEYLVNLYLRNWRRSPNRRLLYVKISAEVVGSELKVRKQVPDPRGEGFLRTRTETKMVWRASARGPTQPTFKRHWWDPAKFAAFKRNNGDKVFRFTFQAPLPIITPFDVLIATFGDLDELLQIYEQSTPHRRQESDHAKRLIRWALAELETYRFEQDENNVALARGSMLSLAAMGQRHRVGLIFKVSEIYDRLLPFVHNLRHSDNPKDALDLANEAIEVLKHLRRDLGAVRAMASEPTAFIYLDDEWARDVIRTFERSVLP